MIPLLIQEKYERSIRTTEANFALKHSAVVVFRTGKGFDGFGGNVEAQSRHVGQILAVDVDLYGIAIGNVVHLMDVIVRARPGKKPFPLCY